MGHPQAATMNALTHWLREGWFLRRDKTAVSALLVLLVLSIASTVMGLQKVESQRAAIEAMIAADAADRSAAQAGLTSYGDAAYYSFYITYDPPQPLAFAAFGQRDTAPFMKRIRLLAIEGQIYQGESPNPLLAQIGSLDLAFIAAYVLPLILIVLLYDLKSSERAAGRHTVLEAMPRSQARLWLPRIGWRMGLAFLCVGGPFFVGAVIQDADFAQAVSALIGIAAVCIFWTTAAALFANRPWRGATIAACLVGVWLTLNILIPLTAQLLFVNQVGGPEGSDVALLQREAVNDAWDTPKEDTLEPFMARFPHYAVEGEIAAFDWRWYFAFQTMGDVTASDISKAYRSAILERDTIGAATSWLSPALAIQRHLQSLANTDITGQLNYDAAVRRYHRTLQDFYFPKVFGQLEYNAEALKDYPKFPGE